MSTPSPAQQQALNQILNNAPNDYYSMFRLTPATATDAAVAAAHRPLKFALHPDKNPDRRAKHAFQLAGEAFHALKDAASRRYFQDWGTGPPTGPADADPPPGASGSGTQGRSRSSGGAHSNGSQNGPNSGSGNNGGRNGTRSTADGQTGGGRGRTGGSNSAPGSRGREQAGSGANGPGARSSSGAHGESRGTRAGSQSSGTRARASSSGGVGGGGAQSSNRNTQDNSRRTPLTPAQLDNLSTQRHTARQTYFTQLASDIPEEELSTLREGQTVFRTTTTESNTFYSPQATFADDPILIRIKCVEKRQDKTERAYFYHCWMSATETFRSAGLLWCRAMWPALNYSAHNMPGSVLRLMGGQHGSNGKLIKWDDTPKKIGVRSGHTIVYAPDDAGS
ncbi:Chaperone protein dnaJ [Elasticomyces elasticus]|nr:Chaperone protein dnaJ [Elasticomyces elasticus]